MSPRPRSFYIQILYRKSRPEGHSWKDFLDEFKALDSSLYDKSKLDELGRLYDKCKESTDDSVEFDLNFLEAVD